MIHSVLPLLFVAGLVLFGISIIKANILPRISGYFLIFGTFVFVAASFVGNKGVFVEVFGALLTGLGFILSGLSLITSHLKLKSNGN